MQAQGTGMTYRVAKTHRMPYVFPQQSPIISGFFAKNDNQLEAFYGSSPPCKRKTCQCILQHNETRENTQKHAATRCNTLQLTASHCNRKTRRQKCGVRSKKASAQVKFLIGQLYPWGKFLNISESFWRADRYRTRVVIIWVR